MQGVWDESDQTEWTLHALQHAWPCGCGRCTECKLSKTSQNNNNMMVNDNNRDRGGLYDHGVSFNFARNVQAIQ